MGSRQLSPLLRHIRKLAASGVSELPDWELVQRYATQGDEAAFAVLVRRHDPMVLGVCQRVLHNWHDAEDIFQATFLVLSRKAASLRHEELVGNWLYGVAYRLALKARVHISRRWARESHIAGKPPIDLLAEITGRELIGVLDEELARLPEKYRAPLVLCCLEGIARDKAAQQFGWSLSTLKRRLEYGRELLRGRLARRGLALSAALSASFLAEGGGHAAMPATFVASTVKAVLSYQSGQAMALVGISKQAVALAEEVLRTTLITKMKIATVLFLSMSVGAAEAGLLARQLFQANPAEGKEVPQHQSTASVSYPTKAEATTQICVDAFGDALPLGALARLGTVRWRHGDQVMAVAFSPDGTLLASGSMDHAIHLSDAKTGKLLRILRGHKTWVGSVFFTPDGKQLISCETDLGAETARVWDVATGKELRRWPTRDSWNFALSPDGKLLAGPGAPGPKGAESIVLWEIATGKPVRELLFEEVKDGVLALVFSPDGTRLVSGGGSTLRLFDLIRGKQIQIFGAGTPIRAVAWSQDGKTLAVGRDKRPVILWHAATLKEARQLDSDPNGARAVAFSPDGKMLAAGGFGPVALWDVTTGKKVRELQGTLYQVWSLAFSADSKTLALGNLDPRVQLWDVSTGKELFSVGGYREGVQFLAFIDHDRGIASASSGGMIRRWDPATARAVREFQDDGTQCYCGDLSPDGRTLALGDGAGAHLLQWSTGKKLHLLKGHKLQVLAVAFSPKGDMLASAANMDPYILCWDVAAGKELHRILTPQVHLHCLTWSPNGKLLASGGTQANNLSRTIDTVYLWNPETGEQLREWTTERQGGERYLEGVRALAFSPDSKLLAAASGDKTVTVWDVASGTMRSRLLGHERGVVALAFSPDGRMLASGGLDRTVRLWELITWKERRRYEGHLGGISKIAFSADGLTMASASWDTSLLLWSVTGRNPREPQPKITLAPQQLESLWNDLASEDASRAWQAVCTLTLAPKQAIPWLNEHLRPISASDQRITHLIRDLDSDQYPTRRQAVRELEKFGDLARPALRKVLEGQPSLEVRRQVERLLEKPGPVEATEVLRGFRAVEVLEQTGTDPARQVLERLAKGETEVYLTQEARAALDRLARKVSAK